MLICGQLKMTLLSCVRSTQSGILCNETTKGKQVVGKNLNLILKARLRSLFWSDLHFLSKNSIKNVSPKPKILRQKFYQKITLGSQILIYSILAQNFRKKKKSALAPLEIISFKKAP